MKIEIKIVPWIYSDEWFNIKVRKEGAWFWTTVREATEDILDNNWYFTKIITRANKSNKEEALSRFSSWEDYLKYKTDEIEKIRVRQKEVDDKRKLKKEELNKLYK